MNMTEDAVVKFETQSTSCLIRCKHCKAIEWRKFPLPLADLGTMVQQFQANHSIEKCSGLLKGEDLVTIYYENEFMGNIQRVEGKLKDFGFQKYAQYEMAPFVKFIPKGKRNPRAFVKADRNLFLMILLGYDHYDPGTAFVAAGTKEFPNATESKYLSFDEHYVTEFNHNINKHIKDTKAIVLLDVRSNRNEEQS